MDLFEDIIAFLGLVMMFVFAVVSIVWGIAIVWLFFDWWF